MSTKARPDLSDHEEDAKSTNQEDDEPQKSAAKDLNRKQKAKSRKPTGPEATSKVSESTTAVETEDSSLNRPEKIPKKKKSSRNDPGASESSKRQPDLDQVAATVDSSQYLISISAEGVSFTSKSKAVQLVRWPFVAGAAKLSQDASGASASFLFCLSEKLKDKKSDMEESTPPVKPSDPEKFSVVKLPKLKLSSWTIKFESSDVATSWISYLQSRLESLGQRQGLRVKVFLNPFSGTKKAMKIWKKVEPIFSINNAIIDLTETQYAGHCEEEAKKIDLTKVDRLITVSGDGLLNEMLNGLMARQDWVDAVRIPLGIIPAGSGNALATSMGYSNAVGAALSIVRGHHRPVDLMAFFQQETPEGEKEPDANAPFKLIRYGFEALMWGIIADVDIESEKYRWMGSARFTVATIPRILNPRYYPGKLLYLPASDKGKTDYDVCQLPSSACSSCLPHADRHEILSSISPTSSKKYKRAMKLYKGRAAGLERSASLNFRPQDLTNPIADLPEDWKSIDGPFVYFVAANITHISNDVLSNPFAHCSDGCVDIAITRTFNDRTKMLNIFATELESGKYVRHDMMEYVKARAFILIPEGPKKGIMDVDGEPLPGAPIAVEIHRGILSFCCGHWASTSDATSQIRSDSSLLPSSGDMESPKGKKKSGKE